MRFVSKTRFLQLAVAAAAVVAFGMSDVHARSRGSYGSYGSYGSSGSYGGSYGSYGSTGSSASYGGSYGSYGSSGSHGGGLFSKWHARKAARKSSYGSYGSYGSSGSYGGSYTVSYGGSSGSSGSSGSYGSYGSYGSSGSYGGGSYEAGYDDGVIYESEPSYVPPVGPADNTVVPPQAPETATPPAAPSASATEAEIFVTLPENAKIFVNDLATTSTGAERHFVSRGLQSGRTYSYKLRVEFDRDGAPVVEDKLIRLQAGQSTKLAFGNAEPAKQAATELKLHVPADAKVTLAGAATQQVGEVRTYASTSLKPGQKWDGYVVRVELEKDGKTLVEERTIDIQGGQTYELSFEMTGDAAKVASVN